MDNYLIDRQVLEQFVDGLMRKKPLAANSPEEINALRERSVKSLDDKIGLAIFSKLDRNQLQEFNQILDRDDADSEVFQNFFQSRGINLEKAITETMKEFSIEFLGGQNG